MLSRLVYIPLGCPANDRPSPRHRRTPKVLGRPTQFPRVGRPPSCPSAWPAAAPARPEGRVPRRGPSWRGPQSVGPRRRLLRPRRGGRSPPRGDPAAAGAHAEGRGPGACGPSGCRGRYASPRARPRAQLLFKGPAGHVARTQLAAARQELRSWAAPLRLRHHPRAAPSPTGRPEESRRARDAAAMAEAAPAPVSAPARGRRTGRAAAAWAREGSARRATWRGLPARRPRPAPRPPPRPCGRALRPTTGRPKRQAGRAARRAADVGARAGLPADAVGPRLRVGGRFPAIVSLEARRPAGRAGPQPCSVLTAQGSGAQGRDLARAAHLVGPEPRLESHRP